MKLNPQKLEGWGYGENCTILTSTVFWLIHSCDRQTDGPTGDSIARST